MAGATKEKRAEIELKRQEIVDLLIVLGWKVNHEYFKKGYGHGEKPDERGNAGYYGYYHLISQDNDIAVTIKPMAMNFFQASRSYAKVLSMLINDVKITANGVQSGKLMIMHKSNQMERCLLRGGKR